MKLTLVLLALVGCVAAFSVPTSTKVKVADAAFLEKQRFLLEIVNRVEDPLMFEEWIKQGKELIYNKSQYTVSSLVPPTLFPHLLMILDAPFIIFSH